MNEILDMQLVQLYSMSIIYDMHVIYYITKNVKHFCTNV